MSALNSSIMPFLEANKGISAFFIALILAPILTKLVAHYSTASLLSQVEDVHSDPYLIEKYKKPSIGWYEKGVEATLIFFGRIYGQKNFSSFSFVRLMQIAFIYFWMAATVLACYFGLITNGLPSWGNPHVQLWLYVTCTSIVIAVIISYFFSSDTS